MQHSFDILEAVEYGLEEAILIWNLRFWIIKNKANKKHLHPADDGIVRTWTYNTNEAFQKLFPYWKKGAIERNIARMLSKKIIVKGNFNSTKYDRTVWYAFYDEEKLLTPSLIISHFSDSGNANPENGNSNSRNQEIENSNSRIGIPENGKYTDNKPVIKPINKPDKTSGALSSEIDKRLWDDFLEMREKIKSKPTEKAKELLINELNNFVSIGLDPNKALENSIKNNWKGLFEPKEKLNKEKEKPDLKLQEIQNEINSIEAKIKFELGKINSNQAWQYFRNLEKKENGFKITGINQKAENYREILQKLNIELQINN